MTWRLVEIECSWCKKTSGWFWANWDIENGLPSSGICGECVAIHFPKQAPKVLKGANDHGESEVRKNEGAEES